MSLLHLPLPSLVILSVDPLRQQLTRFFTGILKSNTDHTIQGLRLHQSTYLPVHAVRSEDLPLGFEDLQLCMAFSNLRRIELNVECNVDFSDSQVLTLASAWPNLESLLINAEWGWNTTGGITPGGLVELLQICRSLNWIALRLDTRGYADVDAAAVLGLTFPFQISIDVVDASIEAESVPAITAFFCSLCATCSKSGFRLSAWDSGAVLEFPDVSEYTERWEDILDHVNAALCWSPESGDSDVVPSISDTSHPLTLALLPLSTI
ncbi:hypothetical protein OG21DRAFT_1604826 [Imleria badia]|nr:hypothetical protein OG21DRAFT_1604826 [Imleria badia]